MYAPVESQDTQVHAALVGITMVCRAHAEFLNIKTLPALAADVMVLVHAIKTLPVELHATRV
jgi:hypothetical protein